LGSGSDQFESFNITIAGAPQAVVGHLNTIVDNVNESDNRSGIISRVDLA